MIRNEKLKKRELNDEQLDFVTGGKQLTFDYVEAFKQMLNNSAANNNFANNNNLRGSNSNQKTFSE